MQKSKGGRLRCYATAYAFPRPRNFVLFCHSTEIRLRLAANLTSDNCFPTQGRYSIKRHPPGPGHPGAHADLDRRREAELGRSVGYCSKNLRLHKPHPSAGSLGEMARPSVGENATPSLGNYLHDKPPSSRGKAAALLLFLTSSGIYCWLP